MQRTASFTMMDMMMCMLGRMCMRMRAENPASSCTIAG